jgi:hypothetical protein
MLANLHACIAEPATWHVVTSMPGTESTVAGELASRGFGCYVPTPEVTGYVFAFVWRDDFHKIPHCPGVGSILTTNRGIPDRNIRDLRILLEQLKLFRIAKFEAENASKPRRRRRPRRSKAPKPLISYSLAA